MTVTLLTPGQLTGAPAGAEARAELLAGLPVVNTVLARLGFDAIVASALPEPDPRCGIGTATVIGVLVRNLALGRQPLYGLAAWAGGFDEALLGLDRGQAARLNDDRAGRALDELYAADRATMTTALSRAAISGYGISAAELHNDSTSLTLYGAYPDARRAPPGGGAGPPRPARGHSKDHRPDLKQLVWILTTCADGTVPFTYRMADGDTEDSGTHIATWESCRVIAGRAGFLYIADSKLATRGNMSHITSQGGRFLTVLPRSRKEDTQGRAWIAGGNIGWAEIARHLGRRKHGPPVTYQAVPAPRPSSEGYRIVWIRSTAKRAIDATARADQIARATTALAKLAGRLDAPRCQLKTRAAVEHAATQAVARASAARWVRFEITGQAITQHRQLRPGRPGPNTPYRTITRHRFTLSFTVDNAQAAHDAASDGCFPLITNDTQMTPAELLAAYKRQPRLERRHATFKGILRATPAELKNDTRIDALGFCLYTALLIHALIERQLRNAMAEAGLPGLPLYPEDRPCATPTAARVLKILSPLARTIICHSDQILTVVPPSLTTLQEQILTLLTVPAGAYQDLTPRPPSNPVTRPSSMCGT
jgi:transposase